MPVNPKSLQNLKRGNWTKGHSGNPAGRPKKLPDIDQLLETVLSEEKDGKTAAEMILLRQRKMAMDGDQRAAEYLLDRAYGKPKQTADVNITERQKQIQSLFPTREEIEETDQP